jgi:hypothetical protein
LVRGDTIQYIYTNAANKNPLRRVIPVDLISEGKEHDYGKEKYREMLLEAAETILANFGFDRTIYGDAIKKKNRKWWNELRQEHRIDIETES